MRRKETPKQTKSSIDTLPQHRLEKPYSQFLKLGYDADMELYCTLFENASEEATPGIIDRLTEIAMDDTWSTYFDPEQDDQDPRAFAPVHALRTVSYFGEAGVHKAQQMTKLFASPIDELREEAPMFFVCCGPSTIPLLRGIILDPAADPMLREGAADSLAELGNEYPEVRPIAAEAIVDALRDVQDTELGACFVMYLMDLGDPAVMPMIDQAYKENRIDPEIAARDAVFTHLQSASSADDFADGFSSEPVQYGGYDDGEPAQVPFVAEEKVGRNDPCPCGSGKKFKKCCGVGR